MRKNYILFSTVMAAMALTSCMDKIETKVDDTYTNEFKDMIGGEIDKAQTWVTGTVISADIRTSGSATVSAYTLGKETRVLYAKKKINGSGTLQFAIPQNRDERIAFEADYGDADKVYRKMDLSMALTQKTTIDLSRGVSTRALAESNSRIDPPAALCGNSNSSTEDGYAGHHFGYTSFPGWTWDNLGQAIPEGANPNGKQITNYELISTGPFYLSLIYGFTGTTTSTILGYYYYQTPGVYSDLVMVDLCEVLKYDYLDGYAKTQFKVIGESQWRDTNFDHYDGEGDDGFIAKDANRRGDGIRCTWRENKHYSGVEGIEGVRGLTFQINVPVGYRLGFYLKASGSQAAQKENLKKLGVAEKYWNISQGLCFSGADLNNQTSQYKFRSVIKKYDGFTFMGLDDSPGGGDYDCNDVSFGLTAGNGGSLPGVLLPGVKDLDNDKYYNNDGTITDEPKESYVQNVIEGRDPFDFGTTEPEPGEGESSTDPILPSVFDLPAWTIGFEDMGTVGDFDFNDVVIKVIPNTANRAKVYLCATGGSHDAELHYDGPSGDINFGSVHNFMPKMTNTMKTLTHDIVYINEVSWPDGYTMPTDAHRFYILTKGKKIHVNTTPGEVPYAICAQGDWRWPIENVRLNAAYTLLDQWAKNVNNSDARDWYNQPTESNVVNLK